MTIAATILYGYHPVSEALSAGRRTIHSIFLTNEKKSVRRDKIAESALGRGIKVQRAAVTDLNTMVGHGRHQGICASVSDYPFSSIDEILAVGRHTQTAALIVLLDRIVDPRNLGAIVRTAQCAGVHGVVMVRNRSAPVTPAVSKASAGAVEHMLVARVPNMVNALKVLKKKQIWIAGADREKGGCLFDADLTIPLAFVIGGEEKGLRPLVKKQCDFLLTIPQPGMIESLNASVAGGILIYETFRQRRITSDVAQGRSGP